MKTLTLAIGVAGLVIVPTASAAWTPAKAAAMIKAKYSTVDPKAAAVIQANIDQEKAGCSCETDARIVSLQASLAAAQHAAKVTKASCKTAGKRFHCTATVAGTFRAPPDYQVYTASVKLTLAVKGRGYRITKGWS